MKILIISNSSSGLFGFRKELIEALSNIGHKVILLTRFSGKEKELKTMCDELIELPMERRGKSFFKETSCYKRISSILDLKNPDMVITYTIKPNLYAGILCAKKKIPYCVNITGLGTAFQNDGMTKKTIILLYKKALKRVKTVFFENPENRDIFLNNGIITKDKTHVLNGAGVNIKEYPFKPYPKNTETRFLFIGRVMKEKGIDEFLTVAKRIKQENENTFFDILGVMEDNYRDVIASYEAEGIVKYHGLQEDVRPFIEKSHCFVLPSYHEGMANTLLECSAMGRPLITSNIHGCLEAVMDGETGYLCKAKDADDLYEKMKKFIKLPYEKKEEMGRLSHEYIAKVFDKRKVVEETISVIMK